MGKEMPESEDMGIVLSPPPDNALRALLNIPMHLRAGRSRWKFGGESKPTAIKFILVGLFTLIV
jgi:hypothetical protein